MKNINKHKKQPITKTFSIRIKKSTLDKVEGIAKLRYWSRNQTIAFLLEQQVSKAETNASSQG